MHSAIVCKSDPAKYTNSDLEGFIIIQSMFLEATEIRVLGWTANYPVMTAAIIPKPKIWPCPVGKSARSVDHLYGRGKTLRAIKG